MSVFTYVPLNDLGRHNALLREELKGALNRVLESGWFILGHEVEAFEREFAAYCGTDHCVGLANGTDALEIAMRSVGIRSGDEVITVANAGMYSTTAIRAIGAIPVYAEIDPKTMLMDAGALSAVTSSRTSAVVVTHLYGCMADMPVLLKEARRQGLAVIEDCAQAHGAQIDNRRAGSWGDVGCFSFYPTKNLGALGDGGAVVTSQKQVADRARQLRQYGWTSKYYSNVEGGRNSRLDEVQAAILRVKLNHLDAWNDSRRQIASRYDSCLAATPLALPPNSGMGEMVYHLYVVRSSERERLRSSLRQLGIGCDVHYPIPDYLQPSCLDLGYRRGHLPVTEQAADEVLSIPCFAELIGVEVDRVVDSLARFFAE